MEGISQINLFLRSLLFFIALSLITFIFGSLVILTLPLTSTQRYRLIAYPWAHSFIWLVKVICGLRYRIIGAENLPQGPAILLSKHQSAWETVAYLAFMPRPVSYVFKRELLFIPFFGWGIGLMGMIHIDRSKGSSAFEQVVRQGQKLLEQNKWIIMFPEGTRTRVGAQGRYKSGGARFALATQTPIVPIAMNSGERWPRQTFIKKPGLITISIGPIISPTGKNVDQLNQEVENWIETEMRRISPHVYQSELIDAALIETIQSQNV